MEEIIETKVVKKTGRPLGVKNGSNGIDKRTKAYRGEKKLNDVITTKEIMFCEKFKETGSKAKAAEYAFNVTTKASASVTGTNVWKRERVQRYLHEQTRPLLENMYRLAFNAKKEETQVSATKDLLDRALGKAPQSMNLEVTAKPFIDLD